MVSHKKNDRPRPLWILKIHKRLSLFEFKRYATGIGKDDGQDISWVLKGNAKNNVYQVTVETMENCETDECKKVIWVPDELAESTGTMFEDFKEDQPQESVSSISNNEANWGSSVNELDENYEKMQKEETFDPYDSDSDTSEDSDFDEDFEDSDKTMCSGQS
ncbi:Long arms of the bivalent protein 1 [Caenorhabditis elegans]|uniref:Long arms of the bivalent protein 1 n=1 Tax=Caenorhabditis elegans TaxID=6239 RepID=LAB1_CAEEL|nr:Long arms of the bivalent protein 1 [Caenorhabditis elegans]Q17604.2 RecName: Full=Long arms of the bivalent protein 1 [Caenorhabditis elegans]CAA99761.1 Long arms of the bivalent protein 1 [Caenorhabditis elegans]|eukprot:NP_492566.1 Long Arms of the Bivalent protein [Caenorhabditis elegans]